MDQKFYSSLEVLKMPVSAVFKEEYFSEIPDSWYIIISDIKNSTAAVTAGRINDVNLVAAGCLIIALNIAKEKNIDIPFFFWWRWGYNDRSGSNASAAVKRT